MVWLGHQAPTDNLAVSGVAIGKAQYVTGDNLGRLRNRFGCFISMELC